MKNTIILFLIILSVNCASQKEENSLPQHKEAHKLSEEYFFKIKEVISDSRCPADVNCVWAGEVALMLVIYKNDAFFKEESLVINTKNFIENKLLLERYSSGKKINTIEVLPIKKQSMAISLEEYSLKIEFAK